MGERVLAAELGRAGLADLVVVDSAGTGDWHIGEQMDARARVELGRRGHDGDGHRARQIQPDWLGNYDLLLAMDQTNLNRLRAMAGGRGDLTGRIALMRAFDPAAPEGAEVPDPYYGDAEDYTEVFDLVDAAAKGLVAQLGDLF